MALNSSPFTSQPCLTIIVLATTFASATYGGAAQDATAATEEVLASGVDLRKATDLTVVAAGETTHVLWKEKRGQSWVAMIDGNASVQCDELGALVSNPATGTLSFACRRQSRWIVISDGKESQDYQEVEGLVFSRDGRRFAYHATRRDRWVMVIDGQEGEEHDVDRYFNRSGPVFSPDGRRVAYGGKQADRHHIWIDGVKSPPYAHALFPSFSDDSKRVGYIAHKTQRGSWAIVMDGVYGPEFRRGVGAPVFSPDGQHVAHSAMLSLTGKSVMVLDGVEIGEASINDSVPVFSPDGRRLAYTMRDGDKSVMMVDGKPSAPYVRMSRPVFSPDSQHIAYRALPELQYKNKIAGFFFKPGNDRVPALVPLGMRESSALDISTGRYYFEDFQTIGVIVLDGIPQTRHSVVGLPWFSATGRLHYVAADAQSITDVIDGKDVHTLASDGLAFTPVRAQDWDGFAYVVHGKTGSAVVIDGVPGPLYDSVVHGSLRAQGNEGVTYLAVRGKDLLRTTQRRH